MKSKVAVAGFRHFHILDLYDQVTKMENTEIVAACEEDQTAREALAEQGSAEITHDDFDAMLAEVDCDVVAIGDYYAKRGSLIIKALSQGKHVISDKPICTSLDELNQIEQLSSEKGLKIGCMLDRRDAPQFIGLRNLVRAGVIGEIQAIAFGGQHPLMLGSRPAWYFEPGKHGGTINDIAIHAIDFIPWITGLQFTNVVAARCWNAFAPDFPHFKDAAQLMLTLDNGCGVLGDVSYFAPNSFGYTLPHYWRMTFWGRQGVLESSNTSDEITLAINGETELRSEPLPDGNPGGYLKSFLRDVQGQSAADEQSTESVLQAMRTTLTIQKAADAGSYGSSL
jgi:predicted dehydrogenase